MQPRSFLLADLCRVFMLHLDGCARRKWGAFISDLIGIRERMSPRLVNESLFLLLNSRKLKLSSVQLSSAALSFLPLALFIRSHGANFFLIKSDGTASRFCSTQLNCTTEGNFARSGGRMFDFTSSPYLCLLLCKRSWNPGPFRT